MRAGGLAERRPEHWQCDRDDENPEHGGQPAAAGGMKSEQLVLLWGCRTVGGDGGPRMRRMQPSVNSLNRIVLVKILLGFASP
jgi:hypothetical protein